MILSVTCLAVAAVLTLVAPWILTRGTWQVRHPRTALTAWFSTFVIGCSLLVGSVLAAVATAVGMQTAGAGSGTGALVTVVSWVGLTAMGAFIGLLSGVTEPLVTAHRQALRHHAPVATSREERGTFTLVRFTSDDPIAIAVPGRRPEILLSSAMSAALTPAQLQAVLAHEYAHLQHRHGLVVRIAELNALVVPRWLRAGASLRRATLLLVELIADDVAARQAGVWALAAALDRIAVVSGDAGLELRSERLKAFRRDCAEPRGLPLPVRV